MQTCDDDNNIVNLDLTSASNPRMIFRSDSGRIITKDATIDAEGYITWTYSNPVIPSVLDETGRWEYSASVDFDTGTIYSVNNVSFSVLSQ